MKLCVFIVGKYMFYCIYVVFGLKIVFVEEVFEEKKIIFVI